MLFKRKNDENKPQKKRRKKIPHRGINKNNNKSLPTLPSSPVIPPPLLRRIFDSNPVTDDLQCAEGEPKRSSLPLSRVSWVQTQF